MNIWIMGEEGGSRANLFWANLSGANLSGANLSGADLSRANLFWANLFWADLSGANLFWADLRQIGGRDVNTGRRRYRLVRVLQGIHGRI
jgi:uncharacterized protein YjbI with pentapeptide repeats